MSAAEELVVVRVQLEHMVRLAEAIPNPETWSSLWDSYNRTMGVPDYTFIAAAGPDRLLLVAREALVVLARHRNNGWACCKACGLGWPCPEVAGVLRAWKP